MTTVSFTGTRRGLTRAQERELRVVLGELRPHIFRHGDCVGADAEAHRIVSAQTDFRSEIVIHPANVLGLRAYKPGHRIHDPLPPLDRNKVMAASCDVLVACPEGREKLRSGTWATVRAARKVKPRPTTLIITPNGTRVEDSKPGKDNADGE